MRGSYVFPVPDSLGYADVALLEPWACVDAAYAPRRRLDLRPDGVLLIAGRADDTTPYTIAAPAALAQSAAGRRAARRSPPGCTARRST